MCRGEYTPFDDYVKSRKSCSTYTIDHLKCIIEGVYTIPSEPRDVYVETINEKSIQILWRPPEQLANNVTHYLINITKLHSFDDDQLSELSTSEFNITVDGHLNSIVVNDLEPFKMYELSVIAANEYGTSLPSVRIRTLTLNSGGGVGDGGANVKRQHKIPVVPKLPGKISSFFFLFFFFKRKMLVDFCMLIAVY